jgi:hypothetical protein
MVTCHNCGVENKEGAKYCTECGTDLVKRTVRCPRCGTENRHDAKYCNECGRSLSTTKSFSYVVGEAVANLRTVLLAALTIIVIAFAVFFFLGNGGKQSQNATTTVALQSTTIFPVVLNPTNGLNYTANLVYDGNTTLSSDVATAYNITIENGVTVRTNGHSMLAGGTFENNGTITAGNPHDNASLGVKGESYPGSFGGSGGAGGGGGGNSNSGSTPGAPKLTAALVQSWYSAGMLKYLTGAGGGGGCTHNGYAASGGNTTAPGGSYTNKGSGCSGVGGTGGSGSYGVFIEANRLIAGNISALGQQGAVGSPDAGGGGGGGVILLAYGPGGYSQGNYGVTGGSGQNDAASGGNGLVLVLNYTPAGQPPVRIS